MGANSVSMSTAAAAGAPAVRPPGPDVMRTVEMPMTAMSRFMSRLRSVALLYEPPSLERLLVVVGALVRSGRQLHFLVRQLLVGNHRQNVRDRVQPRRLLVVGTDDVPRRVLGVADLQHPVARLRVVVPLRPRRHVHRAQLPLAPRVLDPLLEPPLLLVVADLEPDLQQHRAALDEKLLDLRKQLEKALVVVLRAKAHDALDARAVVPASIEDDDFATRGKLLDVALHVDLRLLALGRRGQRDDPEHARAHALGQRADRAPFAGAVASFEDDDDAQLLRLDPFLQVAHLDLQPFELLFVRLALHPCSLDRKSTRLNSSH